MLEKKIISDVFEHFERVFIKIKFVFGTTELPVWEGKNETFSPASAHLIM